MKIAMADSCGLKFTADLKKHWEDQGHEVRYERGASEYLAQWADTYYVDWWDNNIHYLYKLYHGDEGVSRTPDWDNNKKPLVVCRAIDWEVWLGYVRDQQIVDWVDKVICIASHIETKLRSEAEFGNKLKLIRPGVNLDNFRLKQKKTDGFQLGMVLGDMWTYKNHMGGLDIFKQLRDSHASWHLHIRGQHEPGEYNKVMYDYYLESRGLTQAVTLYPEQANMDEWYENIDILLHPGMKEAFSYATAEAAAKGIPVVVNNFFGARDIWPSYWLYSDHHQAVEMIRRAQTITNNIAFRDVITEKYNSIRQHQETDEFIGVH